MRGGTYKRHHEEEEESVFVAMTDMTVSFLFVVMILLAFFASQIQDEDTVPRAQYQTLENERSRLQSELNAALRLQQQAEDRLRELERDLQRQAEALNIAIAAKNAADERVATLEAELARLDQKDPLEIYLAEVADQRRNILESLQKQLKIDFPDLQVVVSEELDALRFKGDGLFERGKSSLRPDKRLIIENIAARLDETLTCFTLGSTARWSETCNEIGAVIEAVQIEGHTDADGPDNANIALSTARANETFFAMTARVPSLVDHFNTRNQPVLSVAGYGKMRPIAPNDTLEGKATNRRIDLRIIMYTPRSADEISAIADKLRSGITHGAPL
ncbi:OmpA family protein [Aureimonas sp. Leaf324]|uniref:OmpA family protein n=1 Tax=Aureimonas sp. Leaf324 TaxID=1736336 RepID=UPI0006FCC309|nr:OmpA family protein [Aureimonas sp. Leaf324]KQQ86070.1 hypothetical protein ASF65_06005 [Aureimonas sp. Leaf324]